MLAGMLATAKGDLHGIYSVLLGKIGQLGATGHINGTLRVGLPLLFERRHTAQLEFGYGETQAHTHTRDLFQ